MLFLHSLSLSMQLRVEGFTVMRWQPKWPEAFKEIAQWIQEVCVLLVQAVGQ